MSESLESLRALWRAEEGAAKDRAEARSRSVPLRERVAAGVALRKLEIVDTEVGPPGYGRVLLKIAGETGLAGLAFGPGDPIVLWRGDDEQTTRGVLERERNGQLRVLVEEIPEPTDGSWVMEATVDSVTFDRGHAALTRLREAARGSDEMRLRTLLFEGREAEWRTEAPGRCHDEALNEPQLEAVDLAARSEDIALIHGPPGTGKTRTLIEVIRRAVDHGESVLATAPSNVAVDNLALRLVEAGVDVVRIGHPGRVSDALEGSTLDAHLERTANWGLARKWLDEADAIRRRLAVRSARGQVDRSARREALHEVARLRSDARIQLRAARTFVLDKAEVICATASGAAHRALRTRSFDLVVLDEATQAPDPIALVALIRGRRWVLAGDPCQLPPTVISREAAKDGLSTTFFERLAERRSDWVRMLKVQHRMSTALMMYPSESMYEGRLRAAPEVANQRLFDLDGVVENERTSRPLVFIDTAGRGWDEVRDDDSSLSNPEQAARTVEEVRALLESGVAPRDIAVITPYRAQVRELRPRLGDLVSAGLEVGTVDAFQGSEREVVVVDCVRSNDGGGIGFLSDVRRMNVAITRARSQLVVIGDSATIGSHRYYAGFLDAVEIYGSWVSAWDPA